MNIADFLRTRLNEWIEPQPGDRMRRCDDRCKCPIHETPLYYAPASRQHACQDIDCVHGHGMV